MLAAHGHAMRSLALTAILLAALAGARAQEPTVAMFDPIQVPSGGQPLTIDRIADIPRQLAAAVERSNCRVSDESVKDKPVLIFRPADGYRVMALVACEGVVLYSRAFLFEHSIRSEPRLMVFPVIAPSGGFSASENPGLMSWNVESRTITAWRGSDFCPGAESRHTYRHAGGELNGFALVKVEHRQLRCASPETEWRTAWEATAWPTRP